MKSRGAIKVTAFMVAALLVQPGYAAEWETGAGVAVGGYYSDNICLAASDEEEKWVGTVRPDVSIRGRGARGNVSLQGGVEYNSLGESSLECDTGQARALTNRASFIPSLSFTSDYDLIRDWLVLDAGASASRSTIDPFAAGANDPLSGRDNNNLIYSYNAGATLQRRIARYAEMRLRYNYNEQFNEVNLFGDSSEDLVEFDLDTLPGTSRLSYGVGGRYSRVEFDESDNRPAFANELSSAEFRAGFQLTSSWQVNGLVGEEWNEFISISDEIDGSYWDVGLRWTPNTRVEVNVGTGERFFGDTPRAEIVYRHKRSTLQASYLKALTFPRNLRVSDAGFGQPGDPLDPDFGSQFTLFGESPITDERFQLAYTFTARRSTIGISGSESRQTRAADGTAATFRDASASFTRTLSSVLSVTARLRWGENEGDGIGVGGRFGENRETWRAGFDISRELGQSTTLTLAYTYTTQDSDFIPNEYDENRVTFSVRHGW